MSGSVIGGYSVCRSVGGIGSISESSIVSGSNNDDRE